MAPRELTEGLRGLAWLPSWAKVLLLAWVVVSAAWLSQSWREPRDGVAIGGARE